MKIAQISRMTAAVSVLPVVDKMERLEMRRPVTKWQYRLPIMG
ncbi:hypothetical protein [Parasphingorhabdus sp.]